MKIIAHRGLSAEYPENTLLAFRKAIESGVDGIETDLRLSLDEEVVLWHDATLKRVGYDAKVEEMRLVELKILDVGEGEEIPTLDELLHFVEAKVTLILEIKYNKLTYEKLCQRINEKIKDKLNWVEVSCFNDDVLKYMHQINPAIVLHKLIDTVSILALKNLEEEYAYVSYLDIDIKLKNLVNEYALLNKFKIIFWTVKDENLKELKASGLYGIMVNNNRKKRK